MKSKVVVVSLKDAVWRRKVISTQLDALGVDYEFFDGLDYRNANITDLLSAEEIETFRRKNRSQIEPPMVGNFASIRAAMQMVYDRGDESAVICEDDAFYSPAFTEVVGAIEQLDAKINLVSLGTLWQFDQGYGPKCVPMPKFGAKYTQLPLSRKLFQCVTLSFGCQGVFIRRNWLEQNLAGMEKIDMHIDWKMFGARGHFGRVSLTPFWSLNLGGCIVYQGIGGDSYSEYRSLVARPPGPPPAYRPWRHPAALRFADYLDAQYLRLFS